ncbi:L,D-transpeptidase family protein [Limnobaculum parvum]|uniref:Transpeptidase n=1 Tax=Limnobaculum parvum TaxID=2172103 RepID=A0A2Y9U1M1_9GAMM|nr:murein L,D-transpeptidase family protein [Limnobaculum parvum]AWH89712.1 transpeptidase [Limnobaculum parvum]
MSKYLFLLSVLLLSSVSFYSTAESQAVPTTKQAIAPSEKQRLLGLPVYIRIIKEEHKLELFVKTKNSYQHIRTYLICSYSGGLGPKKRQGDYKSPEGFYQITANSLNPNSKYYRAFNIGYPNQYDRAHGFTGNYLMIHGACVSVGCYAMTDEQIAEIYQFVEAAMKNGQQHVNINIFPFRMTNENMRRHQGSENQDFWQQLKVGYDYFEDTHQPPNISVVDGRYALTGPALPQTQHMYANNVPRNTEEYIGKFSYR